MLLSFISEQILFHVNFDVPERDRSRGILQSERERALSGGRRNRDGRRERSPVPASIRNTLVAGGILHLSLIPIAQHRLDSVPDLRRTADIVKLDLPGNLKILPAGAEFRQIKNELN